MMHIVCYLRQGSNVFETYWTTIRGVEAMDNSYRLLDLTVYGRQETWEDSPTGWPQQCTYTRTRSGSPTWSPSGRDSKPEGRSDDHGTTPAKGRQSDAPPPEAEVLPTRFKFRGLSDLS
jgi:Bacterial protein of unknown function (DUF899)